MAEIELTESFLAKIAGWQAVKEAKALLQTGHVLSSNWTPPVLKGVVQEGSISYRAGLVLKNSIDIENMCSCRASRQWGTICAHSVAVGLHHVKRAASAELPRAGEPPSSRPPGRPGPAQAGQSRTEGKRIQRAPEGTGTEPLELFVILPPNFAQAWAKGKVMVCLEGKWSRGRAPLNTLPSNVRFCVSEADAKLLDWIEALADGETPGMLMLSDDKLGAFLSLLAEHPRVSLGKSQAMHVRSEPLRLAVEAALEPSGEIRLSARRPGEGALWNAGESVWVLRGDEVLPVRIPKSCLELLKGPVTLPRARVPQFLSQDWHQLTAACGVTANFALEDFELKPQAPKFLLSLSGGLAQLQGQLQCQYGPRILTLGVSSSDDSFWLPDPESPARYGTRDLNSEKEALDRLRRNGFSGPDAQGRFQLLGQDRVLRFFAKEHSRLSREWEVTLEARLEQSTARNLERIEPQFVVTPSGEQWFDLEVSYNTASGERFSAAEIQRLIRTGQGYVRLNNGKTAILDTGAVEELQEVLLDCAPVQHESGYRLPARQAGFIESTLKQHGGWKVQAPVEWTQRARQQSGEIPLEAPDVGELQTVLRPYQLAGVAWLRFLRENHFGGILADEMGLGKTLQALAFLDAVVLPACERSNIGRGGTVCPALVVCPTSLVFNWVAEARKFTPRVRVLALHGPDRHALFERLAECDLAVTSYALIRRDAERYQSLEFDTVILDEAQHIKNRQTQNAQAVKSIQARQRLVLTGTPLENSVLDLWSIFDFLMPGYLGAAQDFRERYEIPMSRNRDPDAQARLARRVRPFLLRRCKRDVAKELPDKIEQVSYCDLTEQQKAVYQQVLELGRREVLESVQNQGISKSRVVMLNALLRLRQICCDLRLLKLENIDPALASGKMDLFEELLEEILDGGHRVLVFSQFVSMLSLVREQLESRGIAYCYLDGATVNRGEVVARFQNTADVPVFLISLKAGGVGLNLAAADTVIHFDPWWNPAVEDQATDRAHRIGQTRIVTSYKLITRGTVEEKILHLQERKRELGKGLFGDEEAFAGGLTWEELQELFA